MLPNKTLILASKSASRRQLLENAGLEIEIDPANIDERALEEPLVQSGFGPDDIALMLSNAKALEVCERHPSKLVIGADQTLGLGNERFHKPQTEEEARGQLLALRGKCHQLYSAISLVQDGECLWQHVEPAHMTMRNFSPEFLGRYLAQIGDTVFQTVGGYQLEGPGVQLFEKIEGDYFTILGLPLIPLLSTLREKGFLDL